MNVAIYIRKSREDREETNENTLERHERILKEYCNKYDAILLYVSHDEEHQLLTDNRVKI